MTGEEALRAMLAAIQEKSGEIDNREKVWRGPRLIARPHVKKPLRSLAPLVRGAPRADPEQSGRSHDDPRR